MKSETKEIVFCNGKLCGRCCGDCLYMDLNDEDDYGDYYCGRKRKYYPAGDKTCGEFEEK